MPFLMQLAGSLAGVLALWLFARWLGLGPDRRIADAGEALRLANEGQYGFRGIDVALDRAGCSALVRDASDRHVLVTFKGNKPVTHMLAQPIEGRLDQAFLTIDPQVPSAPTVTLNLGGQAQYWAAGLRRIPHG